MSRGLEFFVPGSPVAGGSKRAFPVKGRDGKLHVSVTDASGPKGKEWRAAIRFAAAAAATGGEMYGGPLTGPLRLTLCFFLQRPQSHFGKRGLRASAPPFPTTKPDVLKLARAVEDACTGIVWVDDAQVVMEDLRKAYADRGERIGVHVRVEQPVVIRQLVAPPAADSGRLL